MSDTLQCFEALNVNAAQIDEGKGIIRGVCAIKVGLAKGHDTWIDAKTLQTAKDVVSKFAEGIKVKFRHSTAGQFTSIIEETFGLLTNFSIEGDKLRGDLHMLESLAADVKAKAFEMAKKMASQFGLSIDFEGKLEEIDGKKYLRCEKIKSIDLTESPAATDGLFSMKTIKYENGKDGKHHEDCMCGECEGKSASKKMQSLEAALQTLTSTVTDLAAKLNGTKSAPAVGALEYTKDGKTIQLSADAIVTRLEAADKLVQDAKKSVEDSQRTKLIDAISREGRVVMNPKTNVAYKFEELKELSIDMLEFAAKNSPVIPTSVRGSFTGTGGGPLDAKPFTKKARNDKGEIVDVPLSGDELMVAGFEVGGYKTLNEAIASQYNGNFSKS